MRSTSTYIYTTIGQPPTNYTVKVKKLTGDENNLACSRAAQITRKRRLLRQRNAIYDRRNTFTTRPPYFR